MTGERPLRILLSAYACEPGRGSEPGVGWQWAITLARRGCDVWVLTRRNNREPIEQGLAALPDGQRKHLRFIYYDLPRWASWWKRGHRGIQLYYALWQRAVLRVARAAQNAHNFDVVHHLTFGVWRQPSVLYRLGLPFVFGPVGGGETPPQLLVRTLPLKARIAESLRGSANRLALLNPTLRTCLKRATAVAARTPESAAWLVMAGAKEIQISPDIGIESDPWSRPKESPGSPTLKCLYAGNLLGLKGVHLAVEAIAQAVARGADVSFTIVGRGPMLQRLRESVDRCGIGDRVRFVDWLSQRELFGQYARHDVFLFPSLHDSGGTVVLEAFAHGLPVVCFNLGGPGYWVDAETGIAVSPDAVSNLTEALCELADDRARLGRLSSGALQKAQRATWDAAVDAIYDRVESAFAMRESECLQASTIPVVGSDPDVLRDLQVPRVVKCR
jgi:glycosyltransferase involved in cell wall biosynthesis